MTESLLWFNGIDADSGQYLLPPMTATQFAEMVRGRQPETVPARDVQEDLDDKDLSQVGWGVIFAAEDPEAVEIHEALGELLEHRKDQAGFYYHEFGGEDGLKPKESLEQFLVRHKTAPGVSDPERMPYYLLLVGSPEAIPYRFQHQLDMTYAVGRIHFDTLDEYRLYAKKVVAAERSAPRSPRAVLFGPRHPNDPPTRHSADELVAPLADKLRAKFQGWEIEAVLEEDATKDCLGRLLGGEESPAFLLTAGHGIVFPPGDWRQPARQGAILCQGWQGPGNPALQEYYFTADDVTPDPGLSGLITFHFACNSAGTPDRDEFLVQSAEKRSNSANVPFLANLSRRLLSKPEGGALAVVGHVDRAYQSSFFWPGVGQTLQAFEGMAFRLLNGHPIGAAMEPFSLRYGDLAARLCHELQDHYGSELSDESLSHLWAACNDARNYVVVGDPAVRINLSGVGS